MGIPYNRILAKSTYKNDIEILNDLADEMVVRNVIIIVDGNRDLEAIVGLIV